MKTPVRQRQLRGLVLHHRRHPADYPKHLVNRTARWGEPPQNGICRWWYERTAHIRTRWHPYCLNAYRAASGQHPEEIQHMLCETYGDPSDEMGHRLAINVARALGPGAMLRAFTPTTCAGIFPAALDFPTDDARNHLPVPQPPCFGGWRTATSDRGGSVPVRLPNKSSRNAHFGGEPEYH